MLEAVSSVVSNAPLVRGQTEQQSSARSLAANPESVQIVPQAPYISPYVYMDVNFDKAVLQIRDSETGDVVRQIPSEPALESTRRQMAAQARSEALEKRLTPDAPRQAPDAQAVRQSSPTPSPAPEISAPAPQQPQAAPVSASFGAFVRQVASLQSAIAGGSTGTTVSFSA